MKTDTIVSIIVILLLIGFSWALVKWLFKWVLIGGAIYLGYKLFSDKKFLGK